MPLMIALIWPSVIVSAHSLARYLCREPRHIPFVGALIVLSDASLIEPIAVKAGLWEWYEPGLFDIPPIGLLGWCFFAGVCLTVIESNRRSKRSAWWDALMLVVAPLGAHLLLLTTWWGGLRWVNLTIPPWPVVGVVWILAIFLAIKARRVRVPMGEILVRAPAALFFFGLLVIYGRGSAPLVAYSLAFAPVYLILMRAAAGTHRPV
jgi:hypothetical protein